ncbi:MAG TPA: hypothetical protein PKY25_02670 [Bacilli bacterium]|nr:hypothetical protein [Bacilli bacterium]
MTFIKAYKEILLFYAFISLFTYFIVWRLDRMDNINIKNRVVYLK